MSGQLVFPGEQQYRQSQAVWLKDYLCKYPEGNLMNAERNFPSMQLDLNTKVVLNCSLS